MAKTRRAGSSEALPPAGEGTAGRAAGLRRRHLLLGWWMLLVSLTLGLALEALHGFKVRFYLDSSNELRRLLWTLAHAHGTLLGLVNLAFAFSVVELGAWIERRGTLASRFLVVGTLCLPAGFLLGGAYVDGGDPNPAVLLVPAGGLCLLIAVGLTVRGAAART